MTVHPFTKTSKSYVSEMNPESGVASDISLIRIKTPTEDWRMTASGFDAMADNLAL